MGNWLNENKNQIDYYVSSKDVILVERQKQFHLLLELFNSYFAQKEGLRFLDIGCGDGVLTKLLCDLYPKNTFHLLDGSKTMLKKAKDNIRAKSASFIYDTVENFVHSNTNEYYYDFVFSSLAIHHVEHTKKYELFSKIHTLLRHNGLFINIDVVLPSSPKTESIQFKMWVDYINDYLRNTQRDGEVGNHDNLPVIYKENSENKPSSLISQLKMLDEIGFKDVECYYKNGIFALIGGSKL